MKKHLTKSHSNSEILFIYFTQFWKNQILIGLLRNVNYVLLNIIIIHVYLLNINILQGIVQ